MHSESQISVQDGTLRLYTQTWAPEQDPVGVVCLVHGLGEHSGRYAGLGAYLNRRGYILTAFDLRGHGLSEGRRGHADSLEALMQDIDLALEEAAGRYPGLPRFLYGHSLGGLLVIDYVLRRKPQLSGVVVTSPGLRTALQEQKLKVAAVRLGSALLPGLRLPSGLDPRSLCQDPQVIRRYTQDPLVHDRVSLRFGRVMLEAIDWAFAHAAEFSLPLLLMHGREDALAYPRGSEQFASLAPQGVTLKLWDGLCHELHNEPQREAVFDLLAGWLDSHCRPEALDFSLDKVDRSWHNSAGKS